MRERAEPMARAPIPLDDWYADTRTHRHRGHDIVYRRGGAGEALLLIHGFPTAGWDFSKLWEALARHFDVVAPAICSRGSSSAALVVAAMW